MKLFTVAQREVMTANALASRETDGAIDHWPVVKLFMPDGGGRWLLSEVSDDGMAFGLCDLGLGCPELGFVPLDTLQAVRGAWFIYSFHSWYNAFI